MRYLAIGSRMLLILIWSCSSPTATNGDQETVEPTLASQVKPFINAKHSLRQLLDSLDIDVHRLSISITKSEYELAVYYDSILLKNYPVVFGGNPVDDKLRRGDKCTPEGTFRVKSKYDHKLWTKFIWIDYPNEESWKKHNEAKKQGLISSKADIGGEIGIHGVPDGADYAIDYRQNWTLGCISMRNADVTEIYSVIHENIGITIKK